MLKASFLNLEAIRAWYALIYTYTAYMCTLKFELQNCCLISEIHNLLLYFVNSSLARHDGDFSRVVVSSQIQVLTSY
jgi:hypothetical protein